MTTEEFVKHKRPRLNRYGSEFKILVEQLQEFAKLKCKEQRQLCADNVKTYYVVDADKVDEDSILNSPEPEM